MKARCDNRNNPAYHNYGGRGITYQPEWADFEQFAQDVGEPPNSTATIDRIDNNGNYTPENVRWASRATQARNTRQNVWIAIGGVTKCLYDWCDEYGISAAAVYSRMHRKQMDIVTAITVEKSKRFREDLGEV